MIVIIQFLYFLLFNVLPFTASILASFYGSLLGNERENTFAKCLYFVSVFCLQFKTFVERMRMTTEVGITKAREEGH